MKLKIPIYIAALCMTLLSANVGWAIPTLQLDIDNGSYDVVSETTISSGYSFTLRAFLDPKNSDTSLMLGKTYYISAAVEPKQDNSYRPDLGSIMFGGVSIPVVGSASGGMAWGDPPIAALDAYQELNLAPHSMFPTYYSEFSFTFSGSQTIGSYDVQDNSNGNGIMYFKAFDVDISGLSPGYSIHFDLYDESIKRLKIDHTWINFITADDFAPFSHDAQSCVKQLPVPPNDVPDGGITLALLGMALASLGMFRKQAIK